MILVQVLSIFNLLSDPGVNLVEPLNNPLLNNRVDLPLASPTNLPVPKDEAVNMALATPALLICHSHHFPLSRAWYILFMSQDPLEYELLVHWHMDPPGFDCAFLVIKLFQLYSFL